MSPRILIAEDDTNLGIVIEDHLKSEGFDVHWALDGLEALAKFEALDFDLCLLDVMMPRLGWF